MTTSYFALWIPTKKIGEISPVSPPPERKKIQDNKKYEPYYLWGEVDKKALHFSLCYSTKDKRQRARCLKFQCIGHNRHGFIIYSVELPDEVSDDSFLSTIKERGLIPSVYNYMKEHFHKHVHHNSGEDALLLCMQLDAPPSLEKAESWGKIASYYLDLYETKFNNFLQDIKSKHERARALVNDKDSSFKGITSLQEYLKSCRIVKGEFEYCEFLMQNYPAGRKQKNKAIRETMEAIRQESESIEFDYKVCNDEYNIKSSKFSKRLGIISIAISILGLAISIVSLIW